MKIIVVDDEKLIVSDLLLQLDKLPCVSDARGFTSALDALNYLADNSADAAFLDIQMPGMSGLTLAMHIKNLRPDMKIIFLTAYSEYALDAFKQHVSGYLLKPPSDEDILNELNHAFEGRQKTDKRLHIQTFGNFEVFCEGAPVKFARSKSKEVFAYLIDRCGAAVTKKELAAIIWEDCEYTRSKQIQLETLIRALAQSLKEAGAENVLRRGRNSLSLDKDAVSCDYYGFLNRNAQWVNAYHEEYMAQYSWAEITAGSLEDKKA